MESRSSCTSSCRPTQAGATVGSATVDISTHGGGEANAILGVGGAGASGKRVGVEIELVVAIHQTPGWVV